MMIVECPNKRVDQGQLRGELLAAGVVADSSSQFGFVQAVGGLLLVRVADGADPATVQNVVASHVPPVEKTDAQIKRARVRAALAGQSAEDIRLRASLRVLYASLVETRAAFNQMRQQLIASGIPLTVPQLVNRSWEQALQAVEAQIDAEVPDGPGPGPNPNPNPNPGPNP